LETSKKLKNLVFEGGFDRFGREKVAEAEKSYNTQIGNASLTVLPIKP
jgi:hypothetical protein